MLDFAHPARRCCYREFKPRTYFLFHLHACTNIDSLMQQRHVLHNSHHHCYHVKPCRRTHIAISWANPPRKSQTKASLQRPNPPRAKIAIPTQNSIVLGPVGTAIPAARLHILSKNCNSKIHLPNFIDCPSYFHFDIISLLLAGALTLTPTLHSTVAITATPAPTLTIGTTLLIPHLPLPPLSSQVA